MDGLVIKEIGSIPHAIFQAPDSTHFLYPGSTHEEDRQTPIFPARRLNDLVEKVKGT